MSAPGELFTLEIVLGNAAVQTFEDVAFMLRDVADRLDAGADAGVILDGNGNCVGRWGFKA